MDSAACPLGKLGSYTLIEKIAVGGMAEIYLAKTQGHAGFEKHLCLKVIHPNYADDQRFIEMLVDEAKIAVGLNHPNIVQIFDLGRANDTYFIAMEYINGPDLFKVMRRLSELNIDVPIDVAVYIVQEICSGLDYAHRRSDERGLPLEIIHRDISPQNILLTPSGQVKIVDFGIAKAASRTLSTQAGVIKGKYYYMSPEQAWGDPVDQRTDIFSAGIILYEVLVGQMLYLEEDMHRLLDMVRKAEIAPPSSLRPEIPPELDRLVMKALSKHAADRWRSAHEFEAALREFLFAYSPNFSVSNLAELMAEALDTETSVAPAAPFGAPADVFISANLPPSAPPPAESPSSQLFQLYADSLMSRHDYQPRGEHSVIFRMADLIGGSDPAAAAEVVLASADNGPEGDEKTQVTGPPTMPTAASPPPTPSGRSAPNGLPASALDVPILEEVADIQLTFVPDEHASTPEFIIGAGGSSPDGVATLRPAGTPPVPSRRPTASYPESVRWGSEPYTQSSAARGAVSTPSHRRHYLKSILVGASVALVGLAGLGVALLLWGSEPPPRGATVQIISVPAAATVIFDGKKARETAPTELKVADSTKSYSIEVNLPGYQEWRRTITFSKADETMRVLAVLNKIYGKLSVNSLPSGADVYVDGNHRGRTPTTIQHLDPDQALVLELRKRGYRPVTRKLTWQKKTEISAEIELTPSP